MTLVLGAVTALLGVAMIVVTAARGGGPTAIGVLLGVALTALGCVRVWFASASGPRDA